MDAVWNLNTIVDRKRWGVGHSDERCRPDLFRRVGFVRTDASDERLHQSGVKGNMKHPFATGNKKLLGTSATLVVTSALLVVTRSY